MSVNKRYIKAVEKAVDDLIQAEQLVIKDSCEQVGYPGDDYIRVEDACRFARDMLYDLGVEYSVEEVMACFQHWIMGPET